MLYDNVATEKGTNLYKTIKLAIVKSGVDMFISEAYTPQRVLFTLNVLLRIRWASAMAWWLQQANLHIDTINLSLAGT